MAYITYEEKDFVMELTATGDKGNERITTAKFCLEKEKKEKTEAK